MDKKKPVVFFTLGAIWTAGWFAFVIYTWDTGEDRWGFTAYDEDLRGDVHTPFISIVGMLALLGGIYWLAVKTKMMEP